MIVDHRHPDIAAQLLAVQQAAYQIESELIDYPNLPPLHATVADIQESLETFLAVQDNGMIVAALSFAIADQVLEIGRLVVSPRHFRRGLAGQLLQQIEQVEGDFAEMVVSTAAANHPAIRLYEKHGYHVQREWTLPDGLALVVLCKVKK